MGVESAAQGGHQRTKLLFVGQHLHFVEELSAGSIPGAIGIPRGLIEMAADTTFRGRHWVLSTAQSKTVCCICDCPSAGRSSLAAWTLQNMQFQDVCFLKGGIPLWLADGYPLRPLLNPAYSVMRKS